MKKSIETLEKLKLNLEELNGKDFSKYNTLEKWSPINTFIINTFINGKYSSKFKNLKNKEKSENFNSFLEKCIRIDNFLNEKYDLKNNFREKSLYFGFSFNYKLFQLDSSKLLELDLDLFYKSINKNSFLIPLNYLRDEISYSNLDISSVDISTFFFNSLRDDHYHSDTTYLFDQLKEKKETKNKKGFFKKNKWIFRLYENSHSELDRSSFLIDIFLNENSYSKKELRLLSLPKKKNKIISRKPNSLYDFYPIFFIDNIPLRIESKRNEDDVSTPLSPSSPKLKDMNKVFDWSDLSGICFSTIKMRPDKYVIKSDQYRELIHLFSFLQTPVFADLFLFFKSPIHLNESLDSKLNYFDCYQQDQIRMILKNITEIEVSTIQYQIDSILKKSKERIETFSFTPESFFAPPSIKDWIKIVLKSLEERLENPSPKFFVFSDLIDILRKKKKKEIAIDLFTLREIVRCVRAVREMRLNSYRNDLNDLTLKEFDQKNKDSLVYQKKKRIDLSFSPPLRLYDLILQSFLEKINLEKEESKKEKEKEKDNPNQLYWTPINIFLNESFYSKLSLSYFELYLSREILEKRSDKKDKEDKEEILPQLSPSPYSLMVSPSSSPSFRMLSESNLSQKQKKKQKKSNGFDFFLKKGEFFLGTSSFSPFGFSNLITVLGIVRSVRGARQLSLNSKKKQMNLLFLSDQNLKRRLDEESKKDFRSFLKQKKHKVDDQKGKERVLKKLNIIELNNFIKDIKSNQFKKQITKEKKKRVTDQSRRQIDQQVYVNQKKRLLLADQIRQLNTFYKSARDYHKEVKNDIMTEEDKEGRPADFDAEWEFGASFEVKENFHNLKVERLKKKLQMKQISIRKRSCLDQVFKTKTSRDYLIKSIDHRMKGPKRGRVRKDSFKDRNFSIFCNLLETIIIDQVVGRDFEYFLKLEQRILNTMGRHQWDFFTRTKRTKQFNKINQEKEGKVLREPQVYGYRDQSKQKQKMPLKRLTRLTKIKERFLNKQKATILDQIKSQWSEKPTIKTKEFFYLPDPRSLFFLSNLFPHSFSYKFKEINRYELHFLRDFYDLLSIPGSLLTSRTIDLKPLNFSTLKSLFSKDRNPLNDSYPHVKDLNGNGLKQKTLDYSNLKSIYPNLSNVKDLSADQELFLFDKNYSFFKIRSIVILILLASTWWIKVVISSVFVVKDLYISKQPSFYYLKNSKILSRFRKQTIGRFFKLKKLNFNIKYETPFPPSTFFIKTNQSGTFSDLVEIKKLLPNICEILSNLRKSKRDVLFLLKREWGLLFFVFKPAFEEISTRVDDINQEKVLISPKGYLLTGHPGAGKKFLVKSLASEYNVSVVFQEANRLLELTGFRLLIAKDEKENAKLVKKLFQKAKHVSPCLLFVDEIDAIGIWRTHVKRKNMYSLALAIPSSFWFYGAPSAKSNAPFDISALIQYWKILVIPLKYQITASTEIHNFTNFALKNALELPQDAENYQHVVHQPMTHTHPFFKPIKKNPLNVRMKTYIERQMESKFGLPKIIFFFSRRSLQIAVLLQFLIEMDIVGYNQGIVVLGATNRYRFLDYALRRPGRFSGIVTLLLAGKSKRIEVLKMWTQKSGLVPKKKVMRTNRSDSFFFNLLITNKNKQVTPIFVFTLILGTYTISRRRRGFVSPLSLQRTIQQFLIIITSLIINKTRRKIKIILSEKPLMKRVLSDDQDEIKVWFSDPNLSWDYLGRLTENFSQDDLAAAINLSAMKAISQNTLHTIETMEKSIETVKTSNVLKTIDKNQLLIWSYYQAGNAVIQTLLPQHLDSLSLTLLPRHRATRLETGVPIIYRFESKIKLESRLIGLYAGKAAGLVFLSFIGKITTPKNLFPSRRKICSLWLGKNQMIKTKKSKHLIESTYQKSIEVADFYEASYIAYALINNFNFYSDIAYLWKDAEIPAYIAFIKNQNQRLKLNYISQYNDDKKQDRFKLITDDDDKKFTRTFRLPVDQYLFLRADLSLFLHMHLDNYYMSLSREINCYWYRFLVDYLKFETNYFPNDERVTLPDDYHQEKKALKRVWKSNSENYHLKKKTNPLVFSKIKKRSNSKTNITSQKNKSFLPELTWNHLNKYNKDYTFHGLTLTSFNQAFELLDENRELLDYLASYLLRFEILRPNFTLEFVSRFVSTYNPLKSQEVLEKTTQKPQQRNLNRSVLKDVNDKEKRKKIRKRKWGIHSMMMISSFITFTPKKRKKQSSKFEPFSFSNPDKKKI